MHDRIAHINNFIFASCQIAINPNINQTFQTFVLLPPIGKYIYLSIH